MPSSLTRFLHDDVAHAILAVAVELPLDGSDLARAAERLEAGVHADRKQLPKALRDELALVVPGSSFGVEAEDARQTPVLLASPLVVSAGEASPFAKRELERELRARGPHLVRLVEQVFGAKAEARVTAFAVGPTDQFVLESGPVRLAWAGGLDLLVVEQGRIPDPDLLDDESYDPAQPWFQWSPTPTVWLGDPALSDVETLELRVFSFGGD